MKTLRLIPSTLSEHRRCGKPRRSRRGGRHLGCVIVAIVATETIYTLIATLSCDQVCNDFQLLL
ncbi:hypothetical protein CP557_21245 [Natrinema ejinorense]|uniref:Uncharacterized protein n=1 Tax=Natrinema ejinorense TaxID=373386 RepID=A0A2A5QQ59_9EURY|nr:hypothetical protein CP557_21245 [Natrinema ejinorense]